MKEIEREQKKCLTLSLFFFLFFCCSLYEIKTTEKGNEEEERGMIQRPPSLLGFYRWTISIL
jgi:hypothetical protein